MNATLQFSQLVVATLASVALALGIDWALLCAAFRLMRSAPAEWHKDRALAPARVTARSRARTAQERAA